MADKLKMKSKYKSLKRFNPFNKKIKMCDVIKEEEQQSGEEEKQKEVMFPSCSTSNNIKCKAARLRKYAEEKKEKLKMKKDARTLRQQMNAPKQIPRTIENTREPDETIVKFGEDEEQTEEIKLDLATDEFSKYYNNEYEPKVLITYADNPLTKTRIFGRELTRIIPNSICLYRNRSGVKKMVKEAIEKNFTDIIVINENMRQPNGMVIVHLPEGPTMHVKLSNVKITPELKRSHKEFTSHRPQVVVSNFTTRIGQTAGRMLGALFHHDPQYKGRRVVTFHNQRDYIFFRHHRYEFDKEEKKARLRELGPRFTMKLRSLQHGTFDSKYGEYEWIIEGRRHKMETSRRKFFL